MTTHPRAFPVLWLCGPPGVGKTEVAWRFHRRLNESGTATGYVDIDQLGMCYPEPPDDPGRHRLKAANLAGVVDRFAAAGAAGVIVSGVTDETSGPPPGLRDRFALTVCRLRAEPDEVVRRFVGRQRSADLADEVRRVAKLLDDTDVGDLCLDTTDRSVSDVVDQLAEATGFAGSTASWTGPTTAGAAGGTTPRSSTSDSSRSAPAHRPSTTEPSGTVPVPDGRVVWLCGARGSGKSTTGFAVYRALLEAGHTTGYADTEQLGFGPGGHRLKAANLAAVWAGFHAAGARHLVVAGAVDDDATIAEYRAALPGTELTVCRLHAGPEALADRIGRRGRGEGWPAPGDRLPGLPGDRLRSVADRAAAEAVRLDDIGLGDLRFDTDSVAPEAVAAAIVTACDLP